MERINILKGDEGMSYNQPGPYGGPPQQQPGPYGAPPPPPPGQPGPYGQPPAAQPGYGYPQQPPQPAPGYPPQPPTAPMGFPQQQPPPYGYQQPGMPPQPPYGGQPPKKSKAGVVIAVVAAVAVIAGGGWYLVGGGSGGTIDEATKGQKLAFPASVDAYAKNEKAVGTSSGDTPMSADQKTKAEAIGIKDPHQASSQYLNGVKGKAKQLTANGFWGQIADPERALDAYFAQIGAPNPETDKLGLKYEKVGTPKSFTPDGFKGAVMKCVDVKMSTTKTTKPGEPSSLVVPTCVWSDYSTLGAVNHMDQTTVLTGGSQGTQEELSKLAAKLYNTSRTKA
ncbi:hypothetical protein [Streptomyces sp. enrichment culture]|uniref:hypothetical protein n=1 Tax=Streptomyces sp. enrichment culture TaxID=1795815 RepID=UPI003F544462